MLFHPAGGEHGYNNSMQSMHPFFIAMGPSFKAGYSVETFNTVDLYPLMCLLLGIPPAPNNGSLNIVKDLLKAETVKFIPENRDHMWVYHMASLLLSGLHHFIKML